MSSNNIDPAVVTTLVRMTTIDNTSVVDIHSLSSEWNTYLVRFTPANPGPVKLILRLRNRTEAPPSQPCTPADLKIFNPPKVYNLFAEPALCLIRPPRSPGKPKRVVLETRQASGKEAETSHVRKLLQINTGENTAEQDIKRPRTDT
ncbi:hypothetical protein SCLCIDRAFT_31546 [Scleroderma citrinum Foug A]|uniref:Uncharacterized protein n=1 Tax=Scleroderma citrinum Foug A TaxID=1036808 RepID=A0A0C3CZ80_9AGAM|nr:hypothetical protein SCLCIDRAFT_31546 [Scleroderma citrinum Foug A]